MSRRVALTIDAEPGNRAHTLGEDGWRQVLDVLDEEDVRATFFILGSWAVAQPDLTRRTARAGHLIGNHSEHHVALIGHRDRIVAEVTGGEEAIRSVCERTTRPWFRLPFLLGDDDAFVAASLESLGYEHVRENCDSNDWNDAQVPTAELVAHRVKTEAAERDPLVVLFHSWPKITAAALRLVIAHFKAEGASFLTVDQLTADERAALPPTRRDAPRPVATVVIPAYNEQAAIGDCLDSLRAQTVDALEIIVVDDGSTDRTAAIARSRGVQVMTVPHRGPAVAKNVGASWATGDVLVFIDADHILERSCIERLCAPILAGVSVGTFTADIKVANPENGWADCWTLNRGAARGEHFARALPDQWANFRAVGRRAFLEVGGYDDVGYGEDMTLAPKLGALADVVPGAEMWHRHPDTLREVWQNARWTGRGPAVVTAHTSRRFLPDRSLQRGLRGARRLRRPRYLLFAFVYDWGVLSAYWETRLGRRFHAK